GVWFCNGEQTVRELSYGSLMHICKADDPTARFQNVVVYKGAEIKGEFLITDAISDGSSLKPQQAEEKRAFRRRIGLVSDDQLLDRLDKRSPHYQGAEERPFLEGLQSLLVLIVMTLPFLLF